MPTIHQKPKKVKSENEMVHSRLRCDKQTYNRLNNLLKTQLKLFNINKFEEHVTKLNAQNTSLWHKTRRILQRLVFSMPL